MSIIRTYVIASGITCLKAGWPMHGVRCCGDRALCIPGLQLFGHAIRERESVPARAEERAERDRRTRYEGEECMRVYRGKPDLASVCLVLFLLTVCLIICAVWIMQWAGCRLLRIDRASAAFVHTGKGHGRMATAAGLNGPHCGEGRWRGSKGHAVS